MMSKPPVKIGDILEVELISQGTKENNMVAKHSGYIIFVQDCNLEIGSKVNIEVTAALPKYGFAKLVDGPMEAKEDVEEY